MTDTSQEANEAQPCRRQSISVVSPFFNEENLICKAATQMMERLDKNFDKWELILVNDGSTDESLHRLKSIQRDRMDKRLTILSYGSNQGRGFALKAGIDVAQYPIIVTTEADLSWGEDIVERLHDALSKDEDADFVIGSPQLGPDGYHLVPLGRKLLSRWGNKLIKMFFDSNITMHTGMTRAYRRETIQPLKTHSKGKDFHLEVLLKLLDLGFNAIEIPATISWHKRVGANPPKPWASLFNKNTFNTVSSHLVFLAIAQPMNNFSKMAFLAFAGGSGFAVASIWNLLTGDISIFYALTSLFLFLFAFLFMGFAVLFTQLRDLARVEWVSNYSKNMPAAPIPVQIKPGAK